MFTPDPLARRVIGCAIDVHRIVGPGLLESAYRACLAEALRAETIRFEREVPVTLTYRSLVIKNAYRLDFLIDDRLIVEVKSVERVLPVHKAQVVTYLRMTGAELGLLLNFSVPVLRHGVHTVFPQRVPLVPVVVDARVSGFPSTDGQGE